MSLLKKYKNKNIMNILLMSILLFSLIFFGIKMIHPFSQNESFLLNTKELNRPATVLEIHNINKQYENDKRAYMQNVSVISLLAAFLFALIVNLMPRKYKVFANGSKLTSFFLLAYSLFCGAIAGNFAYVSSMVLASFVGLIIIFYRIGRSRKKGL